MQAVSLSSPSQAKQYLLFCIILHCVQIGCEAVTDLTFHCSIQRHHHMLRQSLMSSFIIDLSFRIRLIFALMVLKKHARVLLVNEEVLLASASSSDCHACLEK